MNKFQLIKNYFVLLRSLFYKTQPRSFIYNLIFTISIFSLTLCACNKINYITPIPPVAPPKQTDNKPTDEKKESAASETSEATEHKQTTSDSEAPQSEKPQTTKPLKKNNKKGKTEKILETAYTQIGKLYRYGGTSPRTGFDCSGFTQWVFAQNGVKIPRSSSQQLHAGRQVSRKNLRPGDLLIYSRRIGRRRGTHVGIYVGNGKFIHSPRTGHRIHVSDAFDSYRTRRFIAARRVLEDPDAKPLPENEQQQLAELALKRNKPKHEPPKLHENTFAESYTIYRVKRGDTISGLAKRFHVNSKKLLAANQLRKRDVLHLHQRLMIPVPGGSKGTIVKPGQPRPESGNTLKHKLKRGETLGELAEKYGVSSNEIARANKLSSKHTVRAGQTLVIPGKRTQASNKTHIAAEPAQNSSTYYTVRSGDTIWDISKKFGLSESRLLAANNLEKKHTLRLGQKLIIPQKKSNSGKLEKKKQAKPPKKDKTYTVRHGDTIWTIAKKNGVSAKQLLVANNMSKKQVIRPGQKLIIP